MREHEARRLEVERETGHPFHATKTDAVRSLFDANHAADLEHRRTPDIHGSCDDDIAEELRAAAIEFKRKDSFLANLMDRAARRLGDAERELRARIMDSRNAEEDWREARQTINRLLDREKAFAMFCARCGDLCDRGDIAGIRAELRAARNMKPSIPGNQFTEHRFDREGFLT